MEQYLYIGSTPWGEECAQLGSKNYESSARRECKRFKELLEKKYSNRPDTIRFETREFEHDFGTYYSVVVWYDTDDVDSVEYAIDCEDGFPEYWK